MRTLLLSPAFAGSARGLPLGLAYLGGLLERDGHETLIVDVATEQLSEDDLSCLFGDFRPALLGVTAVCANYLAAIDAIKLAHRELGDSCHIVMGGPHATFSAEAVLTHHPEIDCCVVGEAEVSFPHLGAVLDRQGDRRSVPGVVFGHNGTTVRTPPQAMIGDLDVLPHPARHLFRDRSPSATIGGPPLLIGTKQTELIASRGCPYPCEFCSTKEFWGRRYRRRSPEHVLGELNHLRAQGYTDFYFNDDIFTIERRWVVELCDLLLRTGTHVTWSCGTRVDRVDADLLGLMRASGCRYVYYGVESGDDTIIAGQDKRASVKQAEKAFDLMNDLGIYSSAALIFGLPGETLASAKATIDWTRDILHPREVWISKAACYPGTQLARDYRITGADYETRTDDGLCPKGLIYGTGGIYTPFFNDERIVRDIWDYAQEWLGHLDLGFGDDWGSQSLRPRE